MDKVEVIKAIKALEPELRQRGVTKIALYGSVARDEARPDSDIDLLGKVERGTSLFDVVGIQQFLEEALAHEVHFQVDGSRPSAFRQRIESDLVNVF